jgi:hypothetical protein
MLKPSTMSRIEYVRTLEFIYGDKLSDTLHAKLAKDLQDKGLTVAGMWEKAHSPTYGFTEVTNSSTIYVITHKGVDVYSSTSWGMTDKVFEAFNPIIEGLLQEKRATQTITKRWLPVKGVYVCAYNLHCLEGNASRYYEKPISYEDNLKMEIALDNSSRGLRLKFTITWKPEKVQRKDSIEMRMVEEVLNDMAFIQSIIEGRLKLKKYGIKVKDAEINCHFDAKTESRSECAPDIVNRVREAKKAL